MKVSKEALRTARQCLRMVLAKGTVNESAAKQIVSKFIAEKPRHYLGILSAFQRMLRLEIERRSATVESATPLDAAGRENVLNDLRKTHGADLVAEFKVNPALLGGLRIKLGSNVWDGSVKARLDLLRDRLSA
jgi:F-type H+-transporting ATPase subunit delta